MYIYLLIYNYFFFIIIIRNLIICRYNCTMAWFQKATQRRAKYPVSNFVPLFVCIFLLFFLLNIYHCSFFCLMTSGLAPYRNGAAFLFLLKLNFQNIFDLPKLATTRTNSFFFVSILDRLSAFNRMRHGVGLAY